MATITKPISKKLAEAALNAVKQQFKTYIEVNGEEHGPKLIEAWTESGHWAICWEEGPYEWALNCPHGGVDEELSVLAGKRVDVAPAKDFPEQVFAEPYYTFVLGLYPQI